MKVVFIGAYDDSEVVLAPIKVGKELFKNINKVGINCVYLCYFDDGSQYTRIQKLFGFEKLNNKVFRCGIIPLLFFVRRFNPDIVQIVTPDAFYLPIFLVKRIFKLKIAYLTHSIISCYLKNFLEINFYKKLRLRLIEKVVYRYSDCLQLFSISEARYIVKNLKVEKAKIKIVDNGFYFLGFRKEYSDITEVIKIISIGELSRKEKSFDFLLKALSKINKNIVLTVYSYKEQNISGINVPDNVQLCLKKPLNEIDLRKEFCNNDLFIITSRYETFSLSLLEAMSTGILFVSSNRVGLTKRFPEAFNRFIVSYGDVNKLKNKIEELYRLGNHEKNMITDEIRKFTSDFTWEIISKRYINQYNKLISEIH